MTTEQKQTLDKLALKQAKKNKMEYSIEMYKTINDFLNKKPTLCKSLFGHETPPTNSDYHIGIHKNWDKNVEIRFDINCTDLLCAIRDYYGNYVLEVKQP